jgi:hypothetical protein
VKTMPMGHDSLRAAMIYQHAGAEADQNIANTLDQRTGEARDGARDQARHANGTRGLGDDRCLASSRVESGGSNP